MRPHCKIYALAGSVTRFRATQALLENFRVQPETLSSEYIKKYQNITGFVVELFPVLLQRMPGRELARHMANIMLMCVIWDVNAV